VRTQLIHGERLSGGLLDLLPPDPRTLAPTDTDEALILHLCADTGSDTWPYQEDPRYKVVRIGSDVGVENYSPPRGRKVRGAGANPVCTPFSTLRRGPGIVPSNPEDGMWLVRECLRVIEEAEPVWWWLENPATGSLRKFLGKPTFEYEPWQFGSPWTKRTALWGNFNAPEPIFKRFVDVPLNPAIYVRPGRRPSMAWLHKSAFHDIPEFRDSGMPEPTTDAEMRSLCSQGFARAFKEANP
jgi:hypothetical protein